MINLHNPLQIQKNSSAALQIENKLPSVRKKTLSKKIELGMNSLAVLISLFVLVISFAYLAHANSTATKGYKLKALEQQRKQLIIENEVRDMKIAQITSYKNLSQDQKIKAMEPAKIIVYTRGDTALAAR
jgi:Tfp pilus assembly protein PilV